MLYDSIVRALSITRAMNINRIRSTVTPFPSFSAIASFTCCTVQLAEGTDSVKLWSAEAPRMETCIISSQQNVEEV